MEKFSKSDFMSSEELDALTAGDNTTIIMGYVDGIESIRFVGVAKIPLFKFTLNNGDGKRVRVVAWDDKATLYESSISPRIIVRVSRGLVIPIKHDYYKASDDIIPSELSIRPRTKIELFHKYEIEGMNKPGMTFQNVELKSIADSSGNICVKGYIKVPFVNQTTGHATHGSGAITDGTFKLNVNIAQYVHDDAMVKGVHIEVKGTLKKDKYGSEFLQAQDMGDLKLLDDQVMSPANLRKGFRRSLKRSLEIDEGDKENSHKKKEYCST